MQLEYQNKMGEWNAEKSQTRWRTIETCPVALVPAASASHCLPVPSPSPPDPIGCISLVDLEGTLNFSRIISDLTIGTVGGFRITLVCVPRPTLYHLTRGLTDTIDSLGRIYFIEYSVLQTFYQRVHCHSRRHTWRILLKFVNMYLK